MGWRGYTPLFTPMVGTISGFSLRKFFFGFRVALGDVGRLNLLAYIVECVQIDKEGDGKLFILSFEFKVFKGFKGFKL